MKAINLQDKYRYQEWICPRDKFEEYHPQGDIECYQN